MLTLLSHHTAKSSFHHTPSPRQPSIVCLYRFAYLRHSSEIFEVHFFFPVITGTLEFPHWGWSICCFSGVKKPFLTLTFIFKNLKEAQPLPLELKINCWACGLCIPSFGQILVAHLLGARSCSRCRGHSCERGPLFSVRTDIEAHENKPQHSNLCCVCLA